MTATAIRLSTVPPSLNSIWRSKSRNGITTHYRAPKYNKWCRDIGWELKQQPAAKHRWKGPVCVLVAMKRPNVNSDLDNRLKALGDLLQLHGIIENDRLIHQWGAWWCDKLPEGCAVSISIAAMGEVK